MIGWLLGKLQDHDNKGYTVTRATPTHSSPDDVYYRVIAENPEGEQVAFVTEQELREGDIVTED